MPNGVKVQDVQVTISDTRKEGTPFMAALGQDGQIYTWGNNKYGQLGNGQVGQAAPAIETTPYHVTSGISGKTFKEITTTGRNVLALDTDGQLWAWGERQMGEIGDGVITPDNQVTPTEVDMAPFDGASIVSIAGAVVTCFAMASDGAIYSWGTNTDGVMGNGQSGGGLTTVTASVPTVGPHYGSLKKIVFNDTQDVDASSLGYETDPNNDEYAIVPDVPVPAYAGTEPTDSNMWVPVPVTGQFALWTGTTETNQTASWPEGTYYYRGTPTLTWDSPEPAATLVDTSSAPSTGSEVKFTFTGKNTGTVILADPTFTMSTGGFNGSGTAPTLTCTPNPVPVNGTVTCEGTYALTEADLNAGTLSLTGTLQAKYNNDPVDLTGSPTEKTATINNLIPDSGLTLVKTIEGDNPRDIAAGDKVTYKFAVSNGGSVEIRDINIADTTAGAGTMDAITCTPAAYPLTLAAGASATCTAEYTVAQADVDQVATPATDPASIANTASAAGKYTNANLDATSADSTATLKGNRTPSISITTVAGYDAGTQDWKSGTSFDYTMTVKNTGPTTLTGVQVANTAFNGKGTLGALDCTPALGQPLAPNAEMVCTASYTLTQEDINELSSLSLTESATASSIGQSVSANDTATINGTPVSSATLVKTQTATAGGEWKVGTQNTYTLTVTNTGTATLTDLVLMDAASTGWTGSDPVPTLDCDAPATSTEAGKATVASLAPAATATCSFTYALTQADVNSGKVTNVAALNGKGALGAAISEVPSNSLDWEGTAASTLTMTKSATAPTPFKAGAQVQYTFTVTNQGPATATNVTVTDPGPTYFNGTSDVAGTGTWTDVDCGGSPDKNVIASLPGSGAAATKTCTATYTLTQDDANAGKVSNSATVTGTTPGGTPATPATATAEAGPGTQTPSLTTTVTGGILAAPQLGDALSYQVTVKNTGIVTVTGTDLNVPSGYTASCTPALPVTLAPEAQVSCTVTGTLTEQSVLDAGTTSLTATATGTYNSADVTAQDTGTITWSSVAHLQLNKTVSDITAADYKAGTQITYTYQVTNTGVFSLKDLVINEATGASGFNGVDNDGTPVSLAPTCAETTLAPGASTTCTATYTLSQKDVDNAAEHTPQLLTNTATASAKTLTDVEGLSHQSQATLGQGPGGSQVTPTASVSVAQTVTTKPADGQFVEGADIGINVTVTNNGNVTLTGGTMAPGIPGATLDCPANVYPLAPGQSYTCTLDYKLTETDAANLHVTSTETIDAQYGNGNQTSDSNSVTVSGTNLPQITIEKTSEVDGALAVGTVVNYKFKVTNNGNAALSKVSIIESSFSGNNSGGISDPVCPEVSAANPLLPGNYIECTASYTLVQADLNQGGIANTAIATATAVGTNEEVSSTNSDTAFTKNELVPSLSLTGAATKTGSGVGDQVEYTFTATNTGPVTVTGVTASFNHFGNDGDAAPALTCTPADIDPGQSATCTGTYTLNQGNVDTGAVNATATAKGSALQGTVTSNAADADISLDPSQGLQISAGTTVVSTADFYAGQTVSIPVTVTNNGQTTVSGIHADFTEFDGTNGNPGTLTCNPDELSPGEHATCTVDYVLSQDDINNGGFPFKAQATGTGSPSGDVVSGVAQGQVEGEGAFGLHLDMSAALDGEFVAGSQATFTYTVENTGKVTVDDLKAGKLSFDGSAALGDPVCAQTQLQPGQTTTCTVTYDLTQEDVNNSGITLSGNATGSYGNGKTGYSNNDAASINGVPVNKIGIVKTVARTVGAEDDSYAPGDELTYTFKVSNLGAGTLTDLTLNEDSFDGHGQLGDLQCQADGADVQLNDVTLAPGAEVTCTASYNIAEEDLTKPFLSNTVKAGAKWMGTDVPSETASATLPLSVDPKLQLTIDAQLEGSAFAAGQKVNITYTLTNPGPVPLTGREVSQRFSAQPSGADSVPAVCADPSLVIPVGGSATCTYVYTLTQDDANAGLLSIVADGTAKMVGMETKEASATATATVSPAEGEWLNQVSVEKTVKEPSVFKEGETLGYSFKVTNTGYVDILNFQVNEKEFSGAGTPAKVSCPEGGLAPGQSKVCTASYTLTQADVDSGAVSNTADVSATSAAGTLNSDPSTAKTTMKPLAGLQLKKTASTLKAADFKTGAQIDYKFEVENIGNVTVKDVAIDEQEFTGTGKLSAITCPEGADVLAPGQKVTCVAQYRLTDADVKAAHLSNTAKVDGKLPDGTSVGASSSKDSQFEVVSPGKQTSTAVTKPSKPLAVTGASLGEALAIALVAGAMGVALTRRRRSKAL